MLCVVALVLGLTRAVTAYTATSSPTDAVGGYFAALQRGDAPAALALGVVPVGTHLLLTSHALQEQQKLAPFGHVRVGPVQRTGAAATVRVRYTVAAGGRVYAQDTSVAVHDTSDGWRLDAVAVPVTISLTQSVQRMTLLGGSVPSTSLLAFPGVVPLLSDTAYLAFDPASTLVGFGNDPTVTPRVVVTPAGRAAAIIAVTGAVRRCLSGAAGSAADLCPLPTERFVPGSVRGRLSGALRDVQVTLQPTELGEVSISAQAPVTASYQELDFRDHTSAGHGPLTLQVHAIAIAVAPMTIVWTLT